MIISPPFLPSRGANETEDAYLSRAMTAVDHGRYPVSELLGWHGGVHLTAPASNNNSRLPVRAIADGTVAYVRRPTGMPASPEEHALGYQGWTDDGCVVICHETAIGADSDTETVVRFYSIYLHLNDILPSVQQGESIQRKAEIGRAGMFEGEAGIIHFEIICDDQNLRHLLGRNEGILDIASDGRTDAVFGEMYFKLTAETEVYAERPALSQTVGTEGTALGEDLFVGVLYGAGNAQITTYRPSGVILDGSPLTEPEAEYNLYRDASRIVAAYRENEATVVPAHSAVYELLRFGRVLGPDALVPPDVPHWRQISTPTGQRWVNLNAPGVTKYSDADAPHWAGWHLLQDYQDGDSRCSLNVIRDLLDTNDDGITTQAEARARMAHPVIQRFMGGVVAKFPTEWHRDSVATRWNWLTQEGADGSSVRPHLARDDFPDFQRHAEALCFWEDSGLDLAVAHWHFHPARFIAHFRKCGWLGMNEFTRIYPRATDQNKRTYILEINKCQRKYLLTESLAISHFLGQAGVESNQLRWMSELYNGDPHTYFRNYEKAQNFAGWLGNVQWDDGGTFRGRGFKQLTGRSNYSDYWIYRSWLDPATVGTAWWRNLGWWGIQGNYVRAQHRNILPTRDAQSVTALTEEMRPPLIDNPDRVRTDIHNCIDTAGWFWAKNQLLSIARSDDPVRMTNRIRGDNARHAGQFPAAANYPARLGLTEDAKSVLGDDP